jgi:hypothetical protein
VEGQSSASRGKDRVGRHSRAIFILRQRRSNDGRLATPISDVFSVDEHHHHHILEPTSPLPTQPSVLSAPMTTASGSTTTPPAASTEGGALFMSRIDSVEKWGMRRRREQGQRLRRLLVGYFLPFPSFNPFSDPWFNDPSSRRITIHRTLLTAAHAQKRPCHLFLANHRLHHHIPQP